MLLSLLEDCRGVGTIAGLTFALTVLGTTAMGGLIEMDLTNALGGSLDGDSNELSVA